MTNRMCIESSLQLSEIMIQANKCLRKVYTFEPNQEINTQDVQYLEYEKMNRIIEVDNDNLVAVVEPGVKLGALRRELEEKTLCFIPATHDKENISIGDMFRKKINSLSNAHYGPAKHHIMGLEIILSSGEKVKTGGKTVKNVSGYDLTKLFISSYESLGIPVAYIIKLYPLPKRRIFLHLKADDDKTLLEFAMKLRKYSSPAILYFINTQIVQNNYSAGSWLLLSYEGYEETINLSLQLTKNLRTDDIYELELIDEETFYNYIKDVTNSRYAISDKIKLHGSLWQHITKLDIIEGYFGQIDAGRMNIYIKERDKLVQVQEMIEKLGGYYYKNELSVLSKGLKSILDPNCILNPWVLNERLFNE